MALDGKVALLRAAGEHEGSAWLIDANHALTALHCVQGADGEWLGEVTLEFPTLDELVHADVSEIRRELDVALLKITNPSAALASLILPLSRYIFKQDDKALMRGHPSLGMKANPHGSPVTGKILDPCSPYNGQTKQLNCNAIAVCGLSILPVSNGGTQSTQLQGLSGGPLVWNEPGEAEAVLGLVLEEGMSGSNIYAVTISDIAMQFVQVQDALLRSPHVNRLDLRVLVEMVDSTNVRWSAVFEPAQVGKFWLAAGGSASGVSLQCTHKLCQLGAAGEALMRFAAYAELDAVCVPDRGAWTSRLAMLETAGRKPDTAAKIGNTVAANCAAPAPWHTYELADFADKIHNSLNLRLLGLLSEALYNCLVCNADSNIGGEIEGALRKKMSTIWNLWKTVLEQDAKLLSHFLTGVFQLDSAADDLDEILVSIGCCQMGREQLLLSTLLALALAASGVETAPYLHTAGNLLVDSRSGHACGINKRNRAALHTFAETVHWRSEVVFLPYLGTALMELYGSSVPMTRTEGTAGNALMRLAPVAVTVDRAFLHALAHGAAAVLAYFNSRVQERALHQDAMQLQTRTGQLDA